MTKHGRSKLGPLAYILLILVFAGLIIAYAAKPVMVESIEIASDAEAAAYMRDNNINDVDLIRAVSPNDRKMSDFDLFREEFEVRIGHLYGYLRVDNVEKTGKSSIKISIGKRHAVALISGAKNVAVDSEGLILEVTNSVSDPSVVRISGFSLETDKVNVSAKAKPVGGTTIEDAIKAAAIIRESGYYSAFPSITVKEGGILWLESYKGIPVEIYTRFDILKSLDIAYGLLADLTETGGRVIVTGDKGYYNPDNEAAVTKNGM